MSSLKNREKKEILWTDRKHILGMPISFTKYSVDSERFYIKKGFLNISKDETWLYRIKDLSMTANLFERMFGLGTLQIACSDVSSGGTIIVKSVKSADQLKDLIYELVTQSRAKNRIRANDVMGDSGEGLEDGEYGV